MRIVQIRAAAALLLAVAASRAEAFPAFARKYGMSCTACHVAWPILNQVGQNFRDNGYQFGLGKDDPVTQHPSYVPLALRTTAAYQYTRTTNQPSASGPTTVQTGGVPIPPGVDILSGGTIADDVSFLLVISGFGADGTASVESGWARLDHLGGSNWANLKIGKFELDEPASAHRGVALTSGYAIYGAHGSLVGFDMGENQVGVEFDGHDARSLTRYSLSFTSANGGEGLSRNAWSSPLLYGHLQQAFETGSGFLPWVRVGVLGALGWWPTVFETDPDTGQAIPGTGRVHKQYNRVGAELTAMFGEPTTPLLVTVVWMAGKEDAGLGIGADPAFPLNADPASPSLTYGGGFAEVDWVPWADSAYNATPWMFFGRYDVVRFKDGVPGDTDGYTVGARRYLAVGPRASAAVHLEYSLTKVKGVGAADPDTGLARDVETQAVLAGIDFDF